MKENYTSKCLEETEVHQRALVLIEQLDGLTVFEARDVLEQASKWVCLTMTVDCQAIEYQRARQGFSVADV